MKISLLKWTFITTLCLVSLCVATPFDYERYLSPKRTKPSLSIVNPLDVLRQRVMLEMARRQRENANKQAEINKEILKSIGKRGGGYADDDEIEMLLKNRYYDTAKLYTPYEKSSKAPKDKQHQQQPLYKPSAGGFNVNDKNLNNNSVKGTANEHSHPMAMNESNQDKLYLIDDSSNNFIDDDGDDDESRLFFNLIRNRLYKNF